MCLVWSQDGPFGYATTLLETSLPSIISHSAADAAAAEAAAAAAGGGAPSSRPTDDSDDATSVSTSQQGGGSDTTGGIARVKLDAAKSASVQASAVAACGAAASVMSICNSLRSLPSDGIFTDEVHAAAEQVRSGPNAAPVCLHDSAACPSFSCVLPCCSLAARAMVVQVQQWLRMLQIEADRLEGLVRREASVEERVAGYAQDVDRFGQMLSRLSAMHGSGGGFGHGGKGRSVVAGAPAAHRSSTVAAFHPDRERYFLGKYTTKVVRVLFK